MLYQNLGSMFFRIVTKHAYDRQTDRQNYDPQDRASIVCRTVKQPKPPTSSLFTLNLITVTHYNTITEKIYDLSSTTDSKFILQLDKSYLGLISIILKCLHWLKIHILYKLLLHSKFSHLNLLICVIWSLLNQLKTIAPHLLSMYRKQRLYPLLTLITAMTEKPREVCFIFANVQLYTQNHEIAFLSHHIESGAI